ncbi:hypothetical protein PVBDA_1406780 [Plasmodium vinckei brucechwatti]|uniref:Uncharacterized protein n=1 Tax=Plasmodium vinckei brucechwatti TaxID=119398 RepID=A0A6V7T465_PLAVN|nr:hypothetical protein PVBDA_1406780 [Plasmodium vinckei brucechwatti]
MPAIIYKLLCVYIEDIIKYTPNYLSSYMYDIYEYFQILLFEIMLLCNSIKMLVFIIFISYDYIKCGILKLYVSIDNTQTVHTFECEEINNTL